VRPALLSGATLVECFLNHTRTSPGALAVFPASKERITAAELGESSLRTALALAELGVGPGDLVGLLLPTRPVFLSVFFGVQRAGAACSVLPVPMGFADLQGAARRLLRMVDAGGIRHIVADESFAELAKLLKEQRPALTVVDPGIGVSGDARKLPSIDPKALSVVQFTSGSTSAPKGVMLNQDTMAAGLEAIVVSGQFTPDDVFMQWVPTFHDMGLVGLYSHLLNGADVHVFPPGAALRRPHELLGYFAEHGGTAITGPNFFYDQLLDSVTPEFVAGLDLSPWRLAFNGAEPVRAVTTRRFAAELAPAGLREGVMYPVYGMAEATLAISFPVPLSPTRVLSVDRGTLAAGGRVVDVEPGARTAKEVVSVGFPVHGIQMRIVGEDGRVCGDDEIGEIQICGPAVTTGYLGDPAATAAAFDGPWFRTGDAGFRRYGEHYITGRIKDMVVVRGQNYYPEDIEEVGRQVPGVYRNRCVAFSDSDEHGAEFVTVVVESDGRRVSGAELAAEVARRVEAELDFSDVRVHVVKPSWLTRTTSGKWQRALTRQRVGEL
jgi:acyl-CoA synthetase (AMP-forming)/AMP-acid ligase II